MGLKMGLQPCFKPAPLELQCAAVMPCRGAQSAESLVAGHDHNEFAAEAEPTARCLLV